MKIIFEHEDRKTTVIGTDYNSIVHKIRSLFPNENHRSIQFYDTELTDYFEFNSFEQISDLSNGIKMHFDMSNTSNLFIDDHSLPSSLNNGKNDEKNNHVTPKAHSRRIRKKKKLNLINDEPISLFLRFKKLFLEQTCTHFLRQYSDSPSKSLHYSFVLALTEKFPVLNYLDKNIDGKNGRAPHHTISQLISRKKRTIKYSKTHPTPKRSRLSTINSNANEKTNEELVSEQAQQKDDEFVATVQADDNNLLNQTSLNDLYKLLYESSITKPPPASPDLSIQSQSVVTVHKAILPRDAVKKQKQNETHNSTLPTTTINEATNNVLRQSSMDNTEQLKNSTNDEIWYPKLSRSEQNAYEKDISRLRSIVKPKGTSVNHVSVGEIHVFIRNSHQIRRRMLFQNKDTDFTTKVLQYQEIFHEETYGLPDPHPTIGTLIMPSSTKEFEKAFMFIRNLPYKMPVSIGSGGLHQIVALLLISYITLDHLPSHKLLQILFEKCKKKSTIR
ncbi:unnamed protein product [Rotaria sp. Silwood2]|nr:unnamed protein product [Rotaria sp. Silwood2]